MQQQLSPAIDAASHLLDELQNQEMKNETADDVENPSGGPGALYPAR